MILIRNNPPTVVSDRLSVSYRDVVALDEITLALEAGRLTTLIGPNGSGKSTLLDVIAGLVPQHRGLIAVEGEVAYVLQSVHVNEVLPVTVREVVTMGRYSSRGLLGRVTVADRRLVSDTLDRLELGDLAHRHLGELSGGQRQRVFVAQALVQQAPILLLDEPVTGLDLASRQAILDVVLDEAAAGKLVVMSTHDLGEAAHGDEVILLANRLVAQGPPAEVLTTAHLAEAYRGRIVQLGDGAMVLDDPHHHHGVSR
jgi:manganese transport system ATP-binding protein